MYVGIYEAGHDVVEAFSLLFCNTDYFSIVNLDAAEENGFVLYVYDIAFYFHCGKIYFSANSFLLSKQLLYIHSVKTSDGRTNAK